MKLIKIIFEDDYLLVIDKPAGLHSAKISQSQNPSVADYLLEAYPMTAEASPKRDEAGLVHRLDEGTSGCLMAAKTRAAWEVLRLSFKEKNISKTYQLIVDGGVSDSFFIDAAIGSPYRRAKKVRVYPKGATQPRSLPAHSSFSIAMGFPEKDVTLLRAETRSGRRHQIRAHAAHAGYPLTGDSLYGSKRKLTDIFPAAERTFLLHASEIEFDHPQTGKKMRLFSPLPNWVEEIK